MNEETKPQVKLEKKGVKKEDMIGLVFGISLAWAIGLGGIIPYILGTLFGVWLTRKMLSSEKSYVKIIFWVLLVVVFLAGVVVRGIRSESGYSSYQNTTGDVSLLETDKSPETSQVSGDMYRNTKYHFRIKFPAGWEIKQGDGLHIVQKATSGNSTISVIVQEFDLGGESFSSIKDAGSAKEFIDTAIAGAKEKFSDVKVINYGETKIDNEPAYWVEYSSRSQVLDLNLKMTQLIYFIAKGNIMYSISAGTASDEYTQVRPKFYQSASTFVLEN